MNAGGGLALLPLSDCRGWGVTPEMWTDREAMSMKMWYVASHLIVFGGADDCVQCGE
jgi:hypothetical protein